MQLISERQVGIPLLMEPLDGNNSDKESFRQTIQNYIGQLRSDFKYIVADSAFDLMENPDKKVGVFLETIMNAEIKQTIDRKGF